MTNTIRCFKCVHFVEINIPEHWEANKYGYYIRFPQECIYECEHYHKVIQTDQKRCKKYIHIDQTTIDKGGYVMVKTNDIPSEGETYDIAKLPNELELKATGEKYKAASEGISGGLLIRYVDRKGKSLTQKYGKVSGYVLQKAMKELGLNDTEQLAKEFYIYELTAMRSGYPRMIPVRKAGK